MSIKSEQQEIDKLVEYANGRGGQVVPIAPCSLCGEPSGMPDCGPSWYLCSKCVGTPEAEAAGFTHHN